MEGVHFLEGPRWHDGRLYVSDYYTRRVHVLEPDGAFGTVCTVPGRPSGLGFTPDGELLIASMEDRRILRLGLDGELHELADLSAVAPSDVNDMVVDGAGRAYVGNFGSDIDVDPIVSTNLLRVDPDGQVSVVAEDLVFPNGSVITPDGGTLLVAETFAFRITAFDLAPDGSLSNRRPWAVFADAPVRDLDEALASTAIAPDGICLDSEGGLWIGDALGRGAVHLTRDGALTDIVSAGDLTVYSVALGGSDGCRLFMCASPRLGGPDPSVRPLGRLLACDVDVPATT